MSAICNEQGRKDICSQLPTKMPRRLPLLAITYLLVTLLAPLEAFFSLRRRYEGKKSDLPISSSVR